MSYEHGADKDGSRADRLAQGMVEATTEFDYAELPHEARLALHRAALRVLEYADSQVVVAGTVIASDGNAVSADEDVPRKHHPDCPAPHFPDRDDRCRCIFLSMLDRFPRPIASTKDESQ